MMGRTTFFSGGIPDPVRTPSLSTLTVGTVSLPLVASIPLLQHEGEAAVPLVRPGQSVAEGECLARGASDKSAHVFSSIPGTVIDLAEYCRPDGLVCQTVLVELGGAFPVSTSAMADESWKLMEPAQILAKIYEKGLVTLGLHAVPLGPLLTRTGTEGIRRIVVNAVQPEPWQVSAAWFLTDKAHELGQGISILRRIFGDPEIHFAVSHAFAPALKVWRSKNPEQAGIRYRILENRYPQAEDRFLFQSLFGQDLPAGALAGLAGTLVLEPETILAIRDALVLGRPQMDRMVMVAGGAIRKPGLYRVRLGTPVADVLQEAGDTTDDLARLVCGGPMHGCSIGNRGIPVTRDMGMILALSRTETHDAVQRDCIRCGDCMQTCPAGLEPLRLVRLWANGQLSQAREEGLQECSDCGICSWGCPSRLPLGVWLRQAKGQQVHAGAVGAPDI